jgi:hypothetical protein
MSKTNSTGLGNPHLIVLSSTALLFYIVCPATTRITLYLPVALDQIGRVASQGSQHSLSSIVANNSPDAHGILCHQAKFSMTNAECEQSSECRADVGPGITINTIESAALIGFSLPVGSVQLSKQSNCED